MDLHALYTERIRAAQDTAKDLKRKDITFSSFRLTSIITAAVLAYFYFNEGPAWTIYLALGLMVLFFYLLSRHLGLRTEIKRNAQFIRINEEEAAYLNGITTPFNEGKAYLDHDHLYAFDLDIFGPLSLYSHVNRCVTDGGRRLMAQTLLHDNPAEISSEQEAVKEMVSDIDWRHEWQVRGAMAEEEQDADSAIKRWMTNSNEENIFLSPLLLWPLAIVVIGLIFYGAWTDSDFIFRLSSMAFLLNLMLVGTQMKVMKKEVNELSELIDSMKSYAHLMEHLESRTFHSKRIQELLQELNSEDDSASARLAELIVIMGRMEQMNNLLIAFMFNGLFHFHLHCLRSMFRWRKAHGKKLQIWLKVIHELDVLNSKGNYAYNHPSFTYPEVSDTLGFDAQELGHPLLSATQRVDNDVHIQDFKYVVLTGSNMSGKSTFLKSIGLNLVMMHAGLPCCAKQMTAYPFRVLSSMKAFDSLEKQESFFHAEVLRLKKVHGELQGSRPCFVLLDEILRGTNSDDKRKGTALFLQKIANYQSMGIIATHDVDIAELAEKEASDFEAMYFESQVKNGELTFDYTLRKGVCVTANATDLMRANGII